MWAKRIRIVLGVLVVSLAPAPAALADPLGAWNPAASMTTPRYGAAGAALADGRVLIAGGIDGSGYPTASAEVYDPSANTWTAVAPMQTSRVFAAAAPLPGDRVLVAGGSANGGPTTEAEIFDGTTDTWSAAPPMLVPTAGGTAASLPDGTVWMSGGSSSTETSEIFDPTTDAWSESMSYLDGTGAAAAGLADGKVLVVGGYATNGPGSVWPWATVDPAAGTIETTGLALPLPSYEATATALPGGGVLIAGGKQAGPYSAPTAGAYVFDPSSDSFQAVSPMAATRYGAVAAPLPDGRVLVAGGEGGSGPLASAEAFSPPTLTNTLVPTIGEDRYGLYAGVNVGDLISGDGGSWSDIGRGAPTLSYQWQRCFATCVDVGSAGTTGPSGLTYLVTSSDLGARIRLAVTAVDGTGATVTAVSNAVGPAEPPAVHLAVASGAAPVGGRPNDWISLVRDDTSALETVSYRIWDPDPGPYPVFAPITGVVVFLPGSPVEGITVPVQDHGVPILPAELELALYDASPLPVAPPSQVTIQIADASSDYGRDPANPLELATMPPAGDPLAGAGFYDDYLSVPGREALAWSTVDSHYANRFATIAREPNVERFGAWNGAYPGSQVQSYLSQAAKQEPGTVPMISTYRVVDGHCRGWSDPPADQLAYHNWITSLAEGIGSRRAVLFLEMDSLITTGCLSRAGVAVRMHELRDAIGVLSNCPHLVVYLDAGAADALPARRAASLLRRAGVAQIQGFFLNSTHFDWTSREIRYGEEISRLTGGKHFVVNTAENGQGPLRPRHPATQGNEVLCDPSGRGLGPLPTSSTGYRNVDAFAWIANPGVSGGQCRPGAPRSGVFWPALALELVRHADFRVR